MASDQSTFTALILLSAEDKSGLEEGLLAVLEPFTLTILEKQKIALRGRLILGILISCDPAHVLAIEADLVSFGESSGVDVAIDYSEKDVD
jgi:predicted amino acid-binding ACT domain protein